MSPVDPVRRSIPKSAWGVVGRSEWSPIRISILGQRATRVARTVKSKFSESVALPGPQSIGQKLGK
jgi:hypothetical protein